MQPVSLAVISDLHVGSARATDLNPPDAEVNSDLIDHNILGDFEDLVEREGIRADYLVVPGDVSNRAQPNQVETASEAIERCATALGLSENEVIFVPGNHDVNWKMLELASDDTTGQYWSQRYMSFTNGSNVFRRIAHGHTVSLFNTPYFKCWEYDDLLVVGYNSAWHDSPEPNERVHHGYIHPDHLREISDYLDEHVTDQTDRTRLFLVHHHPIPYSDPTGWKDFSTMQNAEELLSFLYVNDFDILIHGHRHQPRFKLQFAGVGGGVVILCAGSFSAKTYADQIGNLFHLVQVDGRDDNGDGIQGNLYTWAYQTGRGWRGSTEHQGMRHVEAFGEYLQLGALKARVKPIVETVLETKGYVRWCDVSAQDKRLEYVRPDQRMLVLGRIAKELRLQPPSDQGHMIILLRERDDEE